MNRYRVSFTWQEYRSESFVVEAESEADAVQIALDENEEIGEDYQHDGTEPMGEAVDPNQLRLDLK